MDQQQQFYQKRRRWKFWIQWSRKNCLLLVEQRITINFSVSGLWRVLINFCFSATDGLQISGSTCWSSGLPTTWSAWSTASASEGWRPTRRRAAPRCSVTRAAPPRGSSPSQTPPSPGTASPSANRPRPAAPSLSVSHLSVVTLVYINMNQMKSLNFNEREESH